MVTVAKGSVPSRAGQLGSAAGQGLFAGFVPGFQNRRQQDQLIARFDPIRQVLQERTGAMAGPGAEFIQQISSDPASFAQLMQNPGQLQTLMQLNQMAQPQEQQGTGFATLDEINATFEQAQKFRQAGDETRFNILMQRVNDMVGGDVDPDLDLVQLVTDDSFETIQTDGQGNFFDLAGEPVQVPPGSQIVESASFSGARQDVIGQNEARALRDRQVAATNFISTVGNTIELLKEQPNLNTFVARAAAVVKDLKQEGIALANELGMDFDTSVLDPASHAEQFDDLGITNRRIQSLITSLAFQAAAANNQTGRDISNQDVQRFIGEVGANAAAPDAFAAVLQDVATRTVDNFRNDFEIRNDGQEFEGDFGLSEIFGTETPVRSGAAAAGTGVDITETPQELAERLSGLEDDEFLQAVGELFSQ